MSEPRYLALGLSAAAIVVSGAALVLLAREESPRPAPVSTTARPAPTTTPAPPAPVSTTTVLDPDAAAMFDRGWTLIDELVVGEDAGGNFEGRARLRNDGSSSRMATFRFTLFPAGTDSSVGLLTGTAFDVRPGETVWVDLYSEDPWVERAARYVFQVGTTS